MTCFRRATCVIGVILYSWAEPAAAQIKFIDGVFVATKGAPPTELIAYAEANSRGQLEMQNGSLEDAPAIHEIVSVLCSLPLWKPVGAFITTSRALEDDRAERRQLATAYRAFNVYAFGMRIADLERRDKIESLLKAVRASTDTPGYVFVVLATEGDYRRYYPIRLTALER